jgi:hypothetical protein
MIEFYEGNALDRLQSAIEYGNEKEAIFIQDCLDRATEERHKEKMESKKWRNYEEN